MPAFSNYNPYQNTYYPSMGPTTALPTAMPNGYSIPQQQAMPPVPNGLNYVHGIEGAHAFPMPAGVNQIILWDDTDDYFYIKGYDNMGKPKVLAWNEFKPHIENKKQQSQQQVRQPDMSQYITKKDLEKIIGQLTIGEQGRIVRMNEHDA